MEKSKSVISEREQRWADHLAAYEVVNTVKFAQKKEAGEFNKIPDSFI